MFSFYTPRNFLSRGKNLDIISENQMSKKWSYQKNFAWQLLKTLVEICTYLYLNIEINRRYVITAAHCHDKKLRRFQIKEVVLGEWDLEKDPDCEGSCKKVQRFNIRPRDVTMYEDWDINKVTTNGNDIALIRLLEISGYYVQQQ